METMCCICGKKKSRISVSKHWKTGLQTEFVEGTCGESACVKEFEEAIEIGIELAKEEAELSRAIQAMDEEDLYE